MFKPSELTYPVLLSSVTSSGLNVSSSSLSSFSEFSLLFSGSCSSPLLSSGFVASVLSTSTGVSVLFPVVISFNLLILTQPLLSAVSILHQSFKTSVTVIFPLTVFSFSAK